MPNLDAKKTQATSATDVRQYARVEDDIRAKTRADLWEVFGRLEGRGWPTPHPRREKRLRDPVEGMLLITVMRFVQNNAAD